MGKKTEFGYQLVEPIKLNDGATISQIVLHCPPAKERMDVYMLQQLITDSSLKAQAKQAKINQTENLTKINQTENIKQKPDKNNDAKEEDENIIFQLTAGFTQETLKEFIQSLDTLIYKNMSIYYNAKKCSFQSDPSIAEEIKDKISLLDMNNISNKYIIFFLTP